MRYMDCALGPLSGNEHRCVENVARRLEEWLRRERANGKALSRKFILLTGWLVEVGGSEILTSHCSATRGLLATDHLILNHGQVTWTAPELAPPFLTTTPHQREDVSALDRFNVHRCPTRWVFSGTGLKLVTRPATIQYLDHSAAVARWKLEVSFGNDCTSGNLSLKVEIK
ncbi:uncharacterized protein TNCV_5141821 [Trichonephila clavipes]|nr:uncharacterized protein TNCV_5141821 [Trichonephila clavipes]